MSIRISAALAAIVMLFGAIAWAGSINPQIGGGIGVFDGGINTAGSFTPTPPPVACTGSLVLDYSDSCNFMAMGWGQ